MGTIMILSMTGYGRASKVLGNKEITVEIKSVNHRYFDFSAKYPRSYSYLEDKLKTLIQNVITRGKVEVSIGIFSVGSADTVVEINKDLARSYVDALRSLRDGISIIDDVSMSSISKFSDIFTVTKIEENEEEIIENVKMVTSEALKSFVDMRRAEGEKMYEDILNRTIIIENAVGLIEKDAVSLLDRYKTRLIDKLKEVLIEKDINESRVLTEVAIISDKLCVDEETIRLRSHLSQLRTLLEQAEPVGRKLDFLLQEVNREINTIGSKIQDINITSIVIDLKSEAEKIREQIQNIE